jgi:iron(III) transport system ATP-binding protein
MRTEIRRICKEFKLTTIYVTHDQTEALSTADRMAIFSKGNIEQIGTPIDIYKRPTNRFVANFLGETNFIPGVVLPYRKPNADAAPYLHQGSTMVSLGESDSGNSKFVDEEDLSLDELTATSQATEVELAPEVLVQTDLGIYRGVWHLDRPLPKTGEPVTLSIRPESIKLKPYGMIENSTDGIIGQAVYYGEVARYDFIKNDITLKISELNPKHLDHTMQRGLFANVKVDDVVVLQS